MDNKKEDINKGLFGDEIHNTWILLAQTYRLIGNLWDQEIEKLGFTREQGYAIYIIHHLGDKATPGKIAELQFQAHNTTSEILNRMEKQGLVKKFKEADGKNRIKVRLTEKGEQVYRLSQNRKVLDNVFSVLSKTELNNLQKLIKTIRSEAVNLKERKKSQS